jgi:uncharacterized membrane protein
MCASTVLSVWGFAGAGGAQRAARHLPPTTLSDGVDDVAVVSWPAQQARPSAWQARDLAGGPRLSGAFWGFLFAQLFLLPISLRVPPALDDDDLDQVLTRLGLDAAFLRSVRGRVVPGTSALFVLATGPAAAAPGAGLREAGAAALGELTLTAEEAGRWRAGFDE